jgi:hypothetical protein
VRQTHFRRMLASSAFSFPFTGDHVLVRGGHASFADGSCIPQQAIAISDRQPCEGFEEFPTTRSRSPSSSSRFTGRSHERGGAYRTCSDAGTFTLSRM